MMQIKALTLSDGSEVCVSQNQIDILGSDESEAAERIEQARMVHSAIMSWAEQQCEMLSSPPRASAFYREVTRRQRDGRSAWLVGYKGRQSWCSVNDPDLSILRAWALNDKVE